MTGGGVTPTVPPKRDLVVVKPATRHRIVLAVAHCGLGPEIVPKDLLGPDVLSHAYSTLRGVCAASDPSLMRHKASAALEAPTAAPQRLPFLFRRLQ